MEPLSFGEAQPRVGEPIPVGMLGVRDGAARNFQSAVPARLRTFSPRAKGHTETSRSSSYHVASRDLFSPLQFVADTLVIVVLGVAAGIAYHEFFLDVIGPVRNCAFMGLTVALLFAGLARLTGGRHVTMPTTAVDRLRDAAKLWSLAFAALVFFLFALKSGSDVSRGAVLTFYLIGLPAMGAWRILAPPPLARVARRAGYAARECIVIGDNDEVSLAEFAAELAANGSPSPTMMKFHARCERVAWPLEQKQLIARAINAARALKHGEIYLCAAGVPADRLAAIQRALSILPRAIFVVPDAATADLVRCKTSSVGTSVALEVRREPLGRSQRAVKRLIDIVLGALAIVCLAPLWLFVAAAIKLDSAGPVLFLQTRNGYRGRPFKIVKFRTMHVQEDGPVIRQASRDDARVTRIGRFLRKSSIDELPQLLNVLLGQMSLVGPRPHAQAHDEQYARVIENYEVRQHVKPGLTGWAQVHGLRGETATLDQMYRRIEFDLRYAVNASLLLDAEILVRTVFEVFRHRNAY